ncbi:MAG: hypothetical protein HY423_14130 [Candidatus Lambdaproteobacteria bacterium]|nr:hypothetical protein [Candidatus Lambdaproteobacteria bacterium]
MESKYFHAVFHIVTENDRYNGELPAAKEEFERIAGPIVPGSPGYNARINAFHNWYILDRVLAARGVTPLQYYLEFNANSLTEDTLRGCRELTANIHSVFELLKVTKSKTWLRDLVGGKKYAVEGIEEAEYLDRGALFNSRLFPHGEAFFLSNYLLVHPGSLLKRIRGEARAINKAGHSPRDFLFRLALFHSRWEQYRQMDVDKIYRFDA